jgi:type II secretory pathway pseudopilin PulG
VLARSAGASAGVSNPQSGASLVEILVAIAIIALALVVFIAGLSTGSFAVRASNRLTTANNLAAVQLESIKAQAYAVASPCGAIGTYAKIAEPPGYAITVATCELSSKLEQVTVTVSYTGGAAVLSNYKVNR